MLSMREKLSLQKDIKNKLKSLQGDVLSMRAKLQLQREVKSQLTKLGASAAPKSVEVNYLAMPFPEFSQHLKVVYGQDDALSGIKVMAVEYLKANSEKLEGA